MSANPVPGVMSMGSGNGRITPAPITAGRFQRIMSTAEIVGATDQAVSMTNPDGGAESFEIALLIPGVDVVDAVPRAVARVSEMLKAVATVLASQSSKHEIRLVECGFQQIQAWILNVAAVAAERTPA